MGAQIEVIPEAELGVKDKEKISKMKKDPWVAEYSVVKFNKGFDEFGDEFDLVLPDNKKAVKIIKLANDSPISTKHFKGKLFGNRDDAIIELMDNGYGVFGYASKGINLYEIHAIDENKSLILKYDIRKLPKSKCLATFKPELRKERATATMRSGPNTSNCRIKVLMLYSQAAYNAAPNIFSTMSNSIAQANTIFANSDIGGRINVSPFVLVNESLMYRPLSHSDIVLDTETLNTDSYIASLRTAHKADVVMLFDNVTDDRADGNVANFFDPSKPCGITDWRTSWQGRFVFTHELGHLLNARHSDDNSGLPGRGHQWQDPLDPQNSLAILGTVEDITTEYRRLYFSNPNILLNGAPTGLVDRDNSHNVNTSFCSVSEWKNSYDLKLWAPFTGLPGSYTTVIASIEVDQYPCTLNWYAETYPYGTIIKKTENITTVNPSGVYSFTFPSIPPNSYYYVIGKLIPSVTGSVGVNTTVSIYNSGSYYLTLNTNETKIEDEIILYPNPVADSEVGIKLNKLDGNRSGVLFLYNHNGLLIKKIEYFENFSRVEVSELPAGTYILFDPETNISRELLKL